MENNPYGVVGSHASVSSWKVTPDTWGRNVYELVVRKHFIKAGSIIYSTDEHGNLIKPVGGEIPTVEEYLTKGMDNFEGLFIPKTRTSQDMSVDGRVGSGMSYRSTVTPAEFERMVANMKVLKLSE